MAARSFFRYDRIVDHYPEMWPLLVPAYMPIVNGMIDIVREQDYAPKYILDLGCGPGTATLAIGPKCHKDRQVTLCDGSEEMLSAACGHIGRSVHDAVHGDFTDPTIRAKVLPSDRYDLVLCSFALHHISDDEKRQVVEAIAASLHTGGFCLIAEEVVTDRPAGWDVVDRVRSKFVHSHLQAGHISKVFWDLESGLEAEYRLPFLPTRQEDMVSFMARAGLAVSMPMKLWGSALFVGIKA